MNSLAIIVITREAMVKYSSHKNAHFFLLSLAGRGRVRVTYS